MARLTKDQKRAYENYVIDCIIDYDGDVPKEPIKYLFEIFHKEQDWEIKRKGTQNALIEWLQGLPSVIHLPVWNDEQVKLAKEYGSIPENATEKQEQKIIDNFHLFFANMLIQLERRS
tara:strand:+ start:280 stop:633 length:354 start_codon:yes stop_codon:yes gene_type:complete